MLSTIALYPRSDCCGSRLSSAMVDVIFGGGVGVPPAWGTQLGNITTTSAIFLSPPTYTVRLRLLSAGTSLGLSEVGAFSYGSTTNRAAGGTCRASSYASSGAPNPCLVTDGLNATAFGTDASDLVPGWLVLGLSGGDPVASIVVVPRQDGGFAALTDAVVELVLVSSGAALWSVALGVVSNASSLSFSLPLPYAVRVSKPSALGPYVALLGDVNPGVMNQGEVVGIPEDGVRNVLFGVGVFASSINSGGFPPAAAVDGWGGNPSTAAQQFYHSLPSDANPWWVATHGATPISKSIILTPRQDCCSGRMQGSTVELLSSYPAGKTNFAITLPPASVANYAQLEIPIPPYSILGSCRPMACRALAATDCLAATA